MADIDKLVLNGNTYNIADNSVKIANANVYPYDYTNFPHSHGGILVTKTAGSTYHISGKSSSGNNITVNLIDGYHVQQNTDTFMPGSRLFVHFKTNKDLEIEMFYNTSVAEDEWIRYTFPNVSGDYEYTIPSDFRILLARIIVIGSTTYDDDFEFFVTDKAPNFNDLDYRYVAARGDTIALPANADLNDYTTSGIYVLSSSQMSTFQHMPPEHLSTAGWLICYGDKTAALQMYVDFFSEKLIAVRSYNSPTWYEWKTIATSIDFRCPSEGLPSCDLNTVTKSGAYLLIDRNVYTNKPVGVGNVGFLIVYDMAGSWLLQLFITFNGGVMYKRRGDTSGSGSFEDWCQISGSGNTYNITNDYSFPKISQTVTLNASPSITADTNNYLAPTGDTTDRTADILAMLSSNRICRLGAGDYYVNGLVMPDYSTIIGSGHATKIRLIGSSDGFAIKMASFTRIQDVHLLGGSTEPTYSSTIGGRHGIVWEGDYTETQNAPWASMISNVLIENFSGGGITCYDTGYGTLNALEVTNAYILSCWAGINISYWSEFHKFTNVRCCWCYIGCVNNGGNNVFVNCDFSNNREIAMLMDNSQGQSPNNTHGSCVACVFNHTAHNGTFNSGVGIKILNCHSGFIFTGCQIFYSQIYLEDTDGIVVADTNFGYSNCDVTIINGGAVTFSNNMVEGQIPINVTNNQKVRFVNNYTKAGGAIWGEAYGT